MLLRNTGPMVVRADREGACELAQQESVLEISTLAEELLKEVSVPVALKTIEGLKQVDPEFKSRMMLLESIPENDRVSRRFRENLNGFNDDPCSVMNTVRMLRWADHVLFVDLPRYRAIRAELGIGVSDQEWVRTLRKAERLVSCL